MNEFQNPQPVDDWLKVHRLLIAEETNFTDLAIRAASGAVSTEELTAARERLVAMREICSLAYAKAFPGASPRGR
jgi:hypothetical protein